MELRRVEIIDSPDRDGFARLVGEVSYQATTPPEPYWFEVPAEHANSLTESGNPWLVALLPLAVALGEPLRISQPVDSQLLANAPRIMEIWKAWYPELSVVPLDAVSETAAGAEVIASRSRRGRTGAFFSGGVDSFFTLLHAQDEADSTGESGVDELITVWGFDVELKRSGAFARLRERASSVAAGFGATSLDVTTNLRQTRWSAAPWGPLARGCALAAAALAVEARYERVLIPATGGFRDLHPWGSHPLTDPLLSTRRTRFVHDGATHTRTEKTVRLIESESALQALRVCWLSGTDENCGACFKCYRTMVTLDLLGVLDRCTTFEDREVDVDIVRLLRCRETWDYRELRDIRALALQRGRPEVARALDRAMRRSQRRQYRQKLMGRVFDGHQVRRLWQRAEARLPGRWIG